jgi:REP element-mobilizing transposase RayT
MQLSELGEMAQRYWMEIPDHFPFVILDDFVIMPNHIHGIIIINKNDDGQRGIDGWDDEHQRRDAINRVSTETEPKIKTGGFAGNKNPMKNDNLSRIIRWYKGRVSFECRQIHADFAWQSRFHDHIIRDEKSLHNIRNYIFENPLKWDNDEYFMLIS